MTYRYGRTGKSRAAAMLRGMSAYTPVAGSTPAVPVGCVYDAAKKKIVCTDTGDPLGYRRYSATQCPTGMKPNPDKSSGVKCILERSSKSRRRKRRARK